MHGGIVLRRRLAALITPSKLPEPAFVLVPSAANTSVWSSAGIRSASWSRRKADEHIRERPVVLGHEEHVSLSRGPHVPAFERHGNDGSLAVHFQPCEELARTFIAGVRYEVDS
jgi:hypothetical protein